MTATEVTIEKPGVAVSQETKQALVAIGVALVLIALVAAGVNWTVGGETTETTKPSDGAAAQTETVTKIKNGPSESLLTALLGAGAGLIVIGFLYGRISSIKLPGGTEIGLNAEEKKKTVEKVLETTKDPAEAASLVKEAEDTLLARKIGNAGTSLSPLMINDVVQSVAQRVE